MVDTELKEVQTGVTWLLAAAWVLLLLSGCTAEEMKITVEATASSASSEEGVPHPVLDDMEPLVAGELATRRSELDALLEKSGEPETAKGEALGRMGQLYQAHRLLEVAEDCYREAQVRDSESFAWPYYWGVLAARRGDLEVAATALQRAVELAPQDVPAKIRLADLELDRGNTETAHALYDEVRLLDPSLAAAEYGLGRVAAENRDFDKAIEHYSRALAAQPGASVIHYHLGQAYRQLGQIDQARIHLSRSGQMRVAMPDPLMQELTTLMMGASPHLTRGNAALREGRFTAGAAEYRRAVGADPDNFRARQSLASVLLRLGDLESAVEHFEAAVQLAPENARAQSDLGVVLAEVGEDERAIQHLRLAVELEPALVKAQFNLANALARRGSYDEAVNTYRQLLEIDSSHLEARSRLGTALAQAGRLEEGTVELRQVVERDPGDARARLNLGVALAEAGDLQGAIAQHLAVLDLNPEAGRLALTHFNLGTFYKRTGDSELAIESYRRVLEQDPNLAAAHFDLGELLSRSGRVVEALTHYERASEIRPDHGIARLRAASMMMRLERFADAKGFLEKGVAELPANRRLADALARLLAASPEHSLRDGKRSLSIATRVFEAERAPSYAETVAMALAAVGRFGEAIQMQRRVLGEAQKLGRGADVERLSRNLELYESSKTCCTATSDVFPPG